MEDGPCLVFLFFYQILFFNLKWIQNGIYQPKFNNQSMSTELVIYNTYNAVLVDLSFGQLWDEFIAWNPFCPSFPNNLTFSCNFTSTLIPYPIFLLFQKVSELMIRCFNHSCITCNQVGDLCTRTTSSIDLVKLPTLPSYSKDSYVILNCLWSSSDKVSSNLNILTLFVVGTIGSFSSPSLFCSLLRERKLPVWWFEVIWWLTIFSRYQYLFFQSIILIWCYISQHDCSYIFN